MIAQAILRREHVQQGDSQQRTGTGAEQVRAIDRGDPIAIVNEGQPNRGTGGKEGQSQQQVNPRQMKLLVNIPDHLERIERHPLCECKASDSWRSRTARRSR